MRKAPMTDLDVGDGLTIDSDLARQAVYHQLIALKLVLGVPSLERDHLRELAVQKVAYLLGGDDWWEIADQLVDEVLEGVSDD